MSCLVKWELKWIGQNTKMYDSQMHAEAVKRNIEKRYTIKHLEDKVKELSE